MPLEAGELQEGNLTLTIPVPWLLPWGRMQDAQTGPVTGCFQITRLGDSLAFPILFLASYFITVFFLLLFWLQHSRTCCEREEAKVRSCLQRHYRSSLAAIVS